MLASTLTLGQALVHHRTFSWGLLLQRSNPQWGHFPLCWRLETLGQSSHIQGDALILVTGTLGLWTVQGEYLYAWFWGEMALFGPFSGNSHGNTHHIEIIFISVHSPQNSDSDDTLPVAEFENKISNAKLWTPIFTPQVFSVT